MCEMMRVWRHSFKSHSGDSAPRKSAPCEFLRAQVRVPRVRGRTTRASGGGKLTACLKRFIGHRVSTLTVKSDDTLLQ